MVPSILAPASPHCSLKRPTPRALQAALRLAKVSKHLAGDSSSSSSSRGGPDINGDEPARGAREDHARPPLAGSGSEEDVAAAGPTPPRRPRAVNGRKCRRKWTQMPP